MLGTACIVVVIMVAAAAAGTCREQMAGKKLLCLLVVVCDCLDTHLVVGYRTVLLAHGTLQLVTGMSCLPCLWK